jgi:hypothetical protein
MATTAQTDPGDRQPIRTLSLWRASVTKWTDGSVSIDDGTGYRVGVEVPASEVDQLAPWLAASVTAPNGTRTVTIPGSDQHAGYHRRTVTLAWQCPTCGGPRGEVHDALSFDGWRRPGCHSWINPCGHGETYADVRREADTSDLAKMIERAVESADWEPGDAQRALWELRDAYAAARKAGSRR